eukprot:12566586-Heterocapsa_arctica.AAC.1
MCIRDSPKTTVLPVNTLIANSGGLTFLAPSPPPVAASPSDNGKTEESSKDVDMATEEEAGGSGNHTAPVRPPPTAQDPIFHGKSERKP